MADIVERLRQWSEFGYGVEATATMKEAAAEITRLRAENEKLRAVVNSLSDLAHKQIAGNKKLRAALGNISRMKVFPDAAINQTTLAAAIHIARAALGEKA